MIDSVPVHSEVIMNERLFFILKIMMEKNLVGLCVHIDCIPDNISCVNCCAGFDKVGYSKRDNYLELLSQIPLRRIDE